MMTGQENQNDFKGILALLFSWINSRERMIKPRHKKREGKPSLF
jgi:predicted RNA-binding protein with RPS1 domain